MNICVQGYINAPVAQLVEHALSKRKVVGSKPIES